MKITESARDAFLILKQPVATEQKIRYLNKLLLVGFDLLDVGNFDTANDTPQVLKQLALATPTQLLVAVANAQSARAELQRVPNSPRSGVSHHAWEG